MEQSIIDNEGASLWEVGAVTLVPALSMTFGSAAIAFGQPSEKLQARFQHLSAGLLIGAVVCDIFPILRANLYISDAEPKQVAWFHILAAMIGFAAALIVMYSVKSLELDEGDDPPSKAERTFSENGNGATAPLLPESRSGAVGDWIPGHDIQKEEARGLRQAIAKLAARVSSLSQLVASEDVDREAVDEEVHAIDFLVDAAKRSCRGIEPFDANDAARLRYHVVELEQNISVLRRIEATNLPAIDKQLRVVVGTLRHIHSHAERGTFRRWGARPRLASADTAPKEQTSGVAALLPVGLVIAVVVDSMVDGMLIGLSGSVSRKTGCLMAMATAIEMGFLGFSFACSVMNDGRSLLKRVVLFLPPVAMMVASLVASEGAHVIQGSAAFVGLIGFSLVALLFLVVEELLIEAHEKEGGEEWHISVWLYIGLLLSIVLDVLT